MNYNLYEQPQQENNITPAEPGGSMTSAKSPKPTFTGKTILKWSIAYAVLVLILFAGYCYFYFYIKKGNTNVPQNYQVQNSSDTADWKTYTNEKYGYEIKYPADWITDFDAYAYTNDGNGSVVFCPPELSNSKANGLTGKISGCLIGSTNGGSIDPQAPIDLRQCELHSAFGLKACGPTNSWTDKNSQYGYNLFLFNQKYQQVYEKMLSTFKFTDSVSTADWRTYTNDQYGFEIKYPSNWKYSFEGTTNFAKPIVWFCPITDQECHESWISTGSQYGEYALHLGMNPITQEYYSLFVSSFPEVDENRSIHLSMISTFKFTK